MKGRLGSISLRFWTEGGIFFVLHTFIFFSRIAMPAGARPKGMKDIVPAAIRMNDDLEVWNGISVCRF